MFKVTLMSGKLFSWWCLVTGYDTDILRVHWRKIMQPVCEIHALFAEYLPVYQFWELFYLLAAFPVRPEAGVGRRRLGTVVWPTQGQQKVKLSFLDEWQSQEAGLNVCTSFGSTSISNLTVSSESFKLNWFGFGLFCVVILWAIEGPNSEIVLSVNPVKCGNFEDKCPISLHLYNWTVIYWYM